MSNDPVNLYDYEERAKLTLTHNDLGYHRRRGHGHVHYPAQSDGL